MPGSQARNRVRDRNNCPEPPRVHIPEPATTQGARSGGEPGGRGYEETHVQTAESAGGRGREVRGPEAPPTDTP
ncbi:hypothetical protein FQA47_003336 [Oryzias melastigma]|uniref:Uncharacterized protein n=1 Tax=Oryzias melastigma TaxID=30732 RepID=A0A834BWM1_ORYME|nr:hypothetical protein FQA47_003336 [Oryzias melastigma]